MGEEMPDSFGESSGILDANGFDVNMNYLLGSYGELHWLQSLDDF